MISFSYLGHEITLGPMRPDCWEQCGFDCPERQYKPIVLTCSWCPHEHHRTMIFSAKFDIRNLELRQIAFEHAVLKHLEIASS